MFSNFGTASCCALDGSTEYDLIVSSIVLLKPYPGYRFSRSKNFSRNASPYVSLINGSMKMFCIAFFGTSVRSCSLELRANILVYSTNNSWSVTNSAFKNVCVARLLPSNAIKNQSTTVVPFLALAAYCESKSKPIISVYSLPRTERA